MTIDNSTDEDINLSTDISIVPYTEFGLNLKVIRHADSVWMSINQMAEFYDRNRETISEHVKNILKEENLDEKVVSREFLDTTQHGAINGKTQTKLVKYYNLEVIVKVGFRVKSDRGKKLQEWRDKLAINTMKQIGEEIQQQDVLQLSGEVRQLKQAVEQQSNEMFLLKKTNAKLELAILDITTTYRIDEEEKYFLNQLAKERIVELFKLPYNEIDKNQYRIAIASLWRDFKEHFKISKYAMLPRIELENAKKYIKCWNNIPYDRFKK